MLQLTHTAALLPPAGGISFEELAEGLQAQGYLVDRVEVENLMTKLDLDKDGNLVRGGSCGLLCCCAAGWCDLLRGLTVVELATWLPAGCGWPAVDGILLLRLAGGLPMGRDAIFATVCGSSSWAACCVLRVHHAHTRSALIAAPCQTLCAKATHS